MICIYFGEIYSPVAPQKLAKVLFHRGRVQILYLHHEGRILIQLFLVVLGHDRGARTATVALFHRKETIMLEHISYCLLSVKNEGDREMYNVLKEQCLEYATGN